MKGLLKEALKKAANGKETPLAKSIAWNAASPREKQREREIALMYDEREAELENQRQRDFQAALMEFKRQEKAMPRNFNFVIYRGLRTLIGGKVLSPIS